MKTHAYLPGLDLVRVSCIGAILVYHFWAETAAAGLIPEGPGPRTGVLVQCAVCMMTILSGVCLAWRESGRVWSGRRYARDRFLAVYPLFWACFFPLFLYSDLLHGNNADVPRWKLLLSVLGLDGFLQPYTSTFYKVGEWYLGCILLLYLLFPPFWRLMRRGKGQWVGLTALAVWAGGPLLCPVGRNLYQTVWGQLPLFLAGMLLGCARPPRRVGIGLAGAAFLLGLGLGTAGAPDYYSGTLASLCGFGVLFGAGQWLLCRRCTVRRALCWLARQSYGAFLIHHVTITLVFVPALARCRMTPGRWLAALVLLLAVSFGLSRLLSALTGRICRAFSALCRKNHADA